MKLQSIFLLENSIVRKAFWILLLVQTIAILSFPVSISPDFPLPVQSIYVFSNLSLFSILFYSWMFFLLALLFSSKDNRFEKLSLTLIFVLVFLEFWTFKSPLGLTGDALYQMGHVRYLEETGAIPSVGSAARALYGYFDFPGLQIVAVAISEICNLQVFQTQTVFLVIIALVFAFILFVAFLKLFKNSSLASLGVILLTTSSVLIGTAMDNFHPIGLATTFTAFFVLLLTGNGGQLFKDWQTKLIFVILVAGATTEYLFTPFFFFFVLLSIYAIQKLSRERRFVPLGIVIVAIASVLAWEIFWTTGFYSMTASLAKILNDLSEGQFFLATSQTLGEKAGLNYPLWGNVSTWFWWLFVFGFGTLLILSGLRRYKKSEQSTKIWIGGLVGAALVCLFGAFTTVGGVHGGFSRYLWASPFFIVPGLIAFLSGPKIKKVGLVFLFLVLLILSFPTFLNNQHTISTYYIYPQDISTGEFIEKIYGKGYGVNLYGYGNSLVFPDYYVSYARIVNGPEAYDATVNEVWQGIQGVLTSFYKPQGDANLFVHSVREKQVFWEYQGISPDDLNWTQMESQLPQNNEVYNNGYYQLFSH